MEGFATISSLSRDRCSQGTDMISCPSTIHSPQPKRNLKRKFWETSERDDEGHNKRQHLFAFLEGIPEPILRARSDSHLYEMSTRPSRTAKTPHKYDDIDFKKDRVPKASTMPAFVPSVASPPPVSFTPTSSRSFVPPLPTPTPTDDSDSRASRTAHPAYREYLSDNGIKFTSARKAPARLVEQAREILGQPRTSPGLSEEEAKAAMDHLENLRHGGDESLVQSAFAMHRLIPPYSDSRIDSGGNRPFDSRAVPSVEGAPKLKVPKPDQFFAYQHSTFDVSQKNFLNSPSLAYHSKPATTGYFPFFTIEFKSTPRHGSMWVAENQAVTGGALCVNSMERLFEVVNQNANQIDTIAFSCVIDERSVNFWVHYCDRENSSFLSMEVEHFWMGSASDIMATRTRMRNINDWALRDRLPKVLEALKSCSPTFVKDHTRKASPDADQPSSKRRA